MRTLPSRPKRAFWLPASNYYVLAFAISTAVFFIVWGLLHEGGDEIPWATAGISASGVLIGSVLLREIILRRAASRRFVPDPRHLGSAVHYTGGVDNRNPDKLTLEKNAAILREIQKKSDAANVLNRLSAAHREVFELCSEYMSRNEQELKVVAPGSPRLAPLLKGRSAVADFHKYHVLKWAQIEVQSLTTEAQNHDDPEEKKKAAKSALGVIDTALRSYPAEETLIESHQILREMLVSIGVSDTVEKAERAAFEGDVSSAKSLYRDALFDLGRDNIKSDARDRAAERIRAELERLQSLENRG